MKEEKGRKEGLTKEGEFEIEKEVKESKGREGKKVGLGRYTEERLN